MRRELRERPQYPESLDRETWLEAFLVNSALGPYEGPGSLVVGSDEAVDVGDQLADTGERGSTEGVDGQNREPYLDLVQLRGMRRRIVEVDIRMPLQPHVPLRLVGGEVVQDHLNFLALMVGYDAIHEVEELDPATALVVLAGNLAGANAERCQQGGGPVPSIVVRLAGQRFQRLAFLRCEGDLCRRGNRSHSPSNHDSWSSDSGC